MGEIKWAPRVTARPHLVFSQWPQGPDAIRHTEVSVSGPASPPLAQQQMTRWEVSVTSKWSRKVNVARHSGWEGGACSRIKKIQRQR